MKVDVGLSYDIHLTKEEVYDALKKIYSDKLERGSSNRFTQAEMLDFQETRKHIKDHPEILKDIENKIKENGGRINWYTRREVAEQLLPKLQQKVDEALRNKYPEYVGAIKVYGPGIDLDIILQELEQENNPNLSVERIRVYKNGFYFARFYRPKHLPKIVRKGKVSPAQ